MKEGKSSFLNKGGVRRAGTKKLLSFGGRSGATHVTKVVKVFCFFFSRKQSFLALSLFPASTLAAPGAAIFAENCAMCHQPSGEGAVGLAPPLAGTLSRYTTSADGKQYLSQILISGMAGPIETKVGKFSGLMPSFSDKLSDAEAAAVLAYVLEKFNGVTTQMISKSDVAVARARAPSAADTHHLRKTLYAAK
jgi:mono/diheme cytochrome c family protein